MGRYGTIRLLTRIVQDSRERLRASGKDSAAQNRVDFVAAESLGMRGATTASATGATASSRLPPEIRPPLIEMPRSG